LMAALNSFGHSGTNVHLVVREGLRPQSGHTDDPISTPTPSRQFVAEPREPSTSAPELVPLSARTDEALMAYAATLQTFLEAHGSNEGLALADVAHTLQVGREAMPERVMFLVRDIPELVARLAAFRRGDLEHCWRGSVAPGSKRLLRADEDVRE